MCAAAAGLPAPTEGALVLADIFPPQFLHEDGRIVALIDVDAYVVGPRELDFVCLEYFVDERAAQLIARGYREAGPLPALEPVRPVYRFFFWVLTMNPLALGYDRWMSWPAAFA
jgi:aminoglycoside phosphotransferase (APT) family kinase protein